MGQYFSTIAQMDEVS